TPRQTFSFTGGARTAVFSGDDWLAVGSPVNGGPGGSVSVFKRSANTWNLTQTLVGVGASWDSAFGYALAMDDQFLLVGAPEDDVGGSESGSVFLFELQAGQWVFVTRLAASDVAAGGNFGMSVTLIGSQAIVGGNGVLYGYSLLGNVWVEGIHLDVGKAVVGLSEEGPWLAARLWDSTASTLALRLYELVDDALVFRQELTGLGNMASPALEAGQLLVGQPDFNQVAVFSLVAGQWVADGHLQAPVQIPGESFGSAVSSSASRVVVSALDAQRAGGSLYLYSSQNGQWAPCGTYRVVSPTYLYVPLALAPSWAFTGSVDSDASQYQGLLLGL
ncbi:MAG: hypothetical protein JRH20_25140, partial [Deltaproteobacteria bacterium]|nr:hypothetical protein [Deltaproteobacteria bacterium]